MNTSEWIAISLGLLSLFLALYFEIIKQFRSKRNSIKKIIVMLNLILEDYEKNNNISKELFENIKYFSLIINIDIVTINYLSIFKLNILNRNYKEYMYEDILDSLKVSNKFVSKLIEGVDNYKK